MLEKFVIGMCTMSWQKFKDDFEVHDFKTVHLREVWGEAMILLFFQGKVSI